MTTTPPSNAPTLRETLQQATRAALHRNDASSDDAVHLDIVKRMKEAAAQGRSSIVYASNFDVPPDVVRMLSDEGVAVSVRDRGPCTCDFGCRACANRYTVSASWF